MAASIESARQMDGMDLPTLRQQATTLASDFYVGPKNNETKGTLRELTGSDNPYLELQQMDDEDFAARIASNGFQTSIPSAHEDYLQYKAERNTWFDRTDQFTPDQKRYLREHPIASFSLEIAIDKMPQTYSGGLGMLNGDVTRQMSDMGMPVVNVSLLYREGYFQQSFNAEGEQVETYVDQSGRKFPLREAVDTDGDPIGLIDVPMGDHDIKAKAWVAQIGRITQIFLDTDVPENGDDTSSDRWITGHLYSEASEDTRIRQEVLLGIGGVRALEKMQVEPSIYHLQEGHAAFATLEMTAQQVAKGKTLEEAGWDTQDRTAITNHTIVVNDFFKKELVARYMAPIARRMTRPGQEVTTDHIYELGSDAQGRFSMTDLALRTAWVVNGVSELHAKVLRKIYPDQKFEAITNGVHIETWLSDPMTQLFDQYLGSTWRDDLDNTEVFEKIREIPDEEYFAAHKVQKDRFISYINETYGVNLDPEKFTAGLARRFAEYKRNGLILHDVQRLGQIMSDKDHPMQLLIGGKAHPHDRKGKAIIKTVNELKNEPGVNGNVVFINEYDMHLAQLLIPGVDLWINTPIRGFEASGTSGMKAGANGIPNATRMDGWADEVDWEGKGWTFGDSITEEEIQNDDAEAADMYGKLDGEILPMYYSDRSAWVSHMKEMQIAVLQQYSTRRMVKDQIDKIYRPLLEKTMPQTIFQSSSSSL